MKLGLTVLLALLPLALAVPAPQDSDDVADPSDPIGEIDSSDIFDLPAPSAVPVDVVSSTIDMSSVATSLAAAQSATMADSLPTIVPLSKRQSGTCSSFGKYNAPNAAVPPTQTGFQSYGPWTGVSTPISNTAGLYGSPVYTGTKSVGPKNGLISINTFSDYNPTTCAAMCDDATNCQSFAIWRERVPAQKYDATNCPNPDNTPTYQTKCMLYSYALSADDATNVGQWTNKRQFYVAQNSVQFYNKNGFVPASVAGFAGPEGGFGECAPRGLYSDGDDVQTASGLYHANILALTPGPMSTAIDPEFCRKTCTDLTKRGQPNDSRSGIKLNCNMFSLFIHRLNGVDAWQCQYWTKNLDEDRNDNCGNHNDVIASWKYYIEGNPAAYVNTKPPVA